MTTLFADNFNRANGPLGGAWVDGIAALAIVSNSVTKLTGTDPVALNPCVAGYNDHSAKFTLAATSSAGTNIRIVIRSDASFQNAYFAYITINASGGSRSATLYSRVAGSDIAIVTVWNTPDRTAPHTYQFEAVGTRLRLWIDDVLWLEHNDASILGGSYVGLGVHGTEQHLDNFFAYDAVSAGLTCYPSEVPAESVDTAITLWGEGTAWTPGTPGSPTFTSLLGTITWQQVIDAVTAVILYTAPAYQCTDVLSDPDSGATAYLGIGYAIPPGGQFTTQAVANLTTMAAKGVTEVGETGNDLYDFLLAWFELYAPHYDEDLGDTMLWLLAIWDRVHGTLPEEHTLYELAQLTHAATDDILSAAQAAQAAAESADTHVQDYRGVTYPTTDAIVDALEGIGGYSHTTLYNQIAGLGEPDLSPVLDELAAIRTGSDYTLGTIQDNINGLRTLGDWTLGNVRDDIAAVRGSGSPDIAAVLTAIANLPIPEVDLGPVLTAIAGVSTQVSNLQTTANSINGKADDIHAHVDTLENSAASIYSFLGDLHTDVGVLGSGLFSALSVLTDLIVGKFALVLEAAEAIIELIGALAAPPPVHPVWPGLAGVDLGAEIPVTGSTFVAAPMHGLLVTRLTKQVYDGTWGGGGRHYARHWGRAAFETAEGQTEAFQYLGWESGIVIPQQMVIAAGVTLFLEAACTATVQPWTYKA